MGNLPDWWGLKQPPLVKVKAVKPLKSVFHKQQRTPGTHMTAAQNAKRMTKFGRF